MFLYVLVLKLLLKISIVVLVLTLSVEKSLNRWCDTSGNVILNPQHFSPYPPQVVTVVALQWQHMDCLIPAGPKGEGMHGVKAYCG